MCITTPQFDICSDAPSRHPFLQRRCIPAQSKWKWGWHVLMRWSTSLIEAAWKKCSTKHVQEKVSLNTCVSSRLKTYQKVVKQLKKKGWVLGSLVRQKVLTAANIFVKKTSCDSIWDFQNFNCQKLGGINVIPLEIGCPRKLVNGL